MMRKFIPLVVPLLLSGCVNKDMSDLQDFVAEVKSRPAAGIEPIPEIKQVVGFVYSAKSRRDPFTRQEDDVGTTVSVRTRTAAKRSWRRTRLISFAWSAPWSRTTRPGVC